MRGRGADGERAVGTTVGSSDSRGDIRESRGSKDADVAPNREEAVFSNMYGDHEDEEQHRDAGSRQGTGGNVSPKHDWLDFGSWLARHQGDADTSGDPEEDVSENGAADSLVCAESSVAPPAMATTVMVPKDCRQESSLLSSFGTHGAQEISVLLGATGIPASKCPVVPTKMVASAMTALYEPLVKLEVGVLTRAMESPMQLKAREIMGKGTLALYILPDDSLSLTFEAPLDFSDGTDVASAQNTKEVMGIVNMHLGLSDVQSTELKDVHGTVWEELARFPRWREQSDSSIVTVHMLKGDKTGRSFYVLAGDEAIPPQFSLSSDSQRKFDNFRSVNSAAVGTGDERAPKSRRHYFWMMGSDVEESINALGKMKSYIKRPPTLSKISGVPENVLENVTDWIARVEEMQRERANNEGRDQVLENPLKNLGAVLGRRTPHMAVNQSISGSDEDADGETRPIVICSDVSVTANASAVFKDSRFNVSCPCCLSVAWNIKRTIHMEAPDMMVVDAANSSSTEHASESDDGDECSMNDVSCASQGHSAGTSRQPPRDSSSGSSNVTAITRVHRQREERILKVAAMIATAEARCTSEVLARRAVEAIGKVRIEEWICEDFVRNTRKHRILAKAERQRKKELQRGYDKLEAAKPMIQRAIAKLVDADDADGTDAANSVDSADRADSAVATADRDVLSPIQSPEVSQPVVEPVVEEVPSRGKKISITDLSKLF